MTWWNAFVFAFTVTAAIADVRSRKIPRTYTTLGLLIGLGYHAMTHTLWSSAGAALTGFLVALAFFELGAIGGGDVKLIAALGALLGFPRWAMAMETAAIVAGAMALVQVIRRRALKQTLRNMGELVRGIATIGWHSHPTINVKNEATIRAPFGVAAAVGTLLALIRP